MKSVKKILHSILTFSFLNLIFLKQFVYADVITDVRYERVVRDEYTASYYIAIIAVLAIVVGVSIFILRKIYKSNQLENKKGKEVQEE